MPRATKGTGSISHDPKNNRYHGQITISGQRYKVYGKTKTETRTKLNAVIAAGGKPQPEGHPVTATGASVQTVTELVTEWIAKDLSTRSKTSPSTVQRAEYAAKHIIKHIGNIPAADLTTRQVETMLAAMTDAGLSRATCQKSLTTLNQAIIWANRRGELDRHVTKWAVIPPEAPGTEPRQSLTPDQAHQLLDALKTERNGLMFAMSLRLAVRPGEASALYWEDLTTDSNGAVIVNVTRGTRTVSGTTEVVNDLKTSSAKRTIEAPPDIAAWITDHRKAQAAERLAAPQWRDDRLVFASRTGHVISPRNPRRQLAEICARLGDDFPTIRPNELRHSCISLLSDQGVSNEELADLAGHTTTRMVDSTYRHRLRPVIDVAATADWLTG